MSYTYKIVPIDQIHPNPRNTRTHPKKQIKQVAASISAVGFAAPVLIDEHGVLLAGHARLEAARLLGMTSVPTIVISGLSDAQKRALLLADNRIAQNAGWDREQLAVELAALPELLIEVGLDISITGFEPTEIDSLIADFEDAVTDPADEVDPSCILGPAVTRSGDLWGWTNSGCFVATRAAATTSGTCSPDSGPTWRSWIPRTTSASEASSDAEP